MSRAHPNAATPTAVALALSLLLTVGPAAAQALSTSPDGQALLDGAAQRAWSRCVEGMRWDGRACQGEARRVTHAEALAAARARSEADGLPWRVPTVPELRHFGERLAHAAQPAALAPAAPAGWYWTSTARIDSEAVNPYAYSNVQRGATESHVDRLVVQVGWVVDPRSGETRGDMPRRERLPLRLVRSTEP